MISSVAMAEDSGFPFFSVLPPLGLSGSVGYTFQTQEVGNKPREFRNLVSGNAVASTYIWQPWFSTVDGNLNMTRDVTAGSAESDSLVVTGSANLTALPLSNFPTTLSYLRADSTVDGTLFTSQTTTQRTSIRNRVSLPDLQLTVVTTAALEDTERSDIGTEDVMLGAVDVTKAFETSTVNATLKHDESVFTPKNGGTENDRVNDLVNFRHDYQPLENVYVQSSSTMLRSNELLQGTERDTFFIQGVTSGQWRPTEVPMTVNGALRTLTQSLDVGSTSTDIQSVAGTVGTNYVIAPRLTTNVGLNANYQSIATSAGAESGEVSSTGSQRQDATASAGINYTSEDTEIAGFTWDWNASGLGQAGYASEGPGTQSLSVGLGHTANRALDVPVVGLSTFAASEQGSVGYSADGEVVPLVSHNASLTRSFSETRVRTFIRFSGTDTRELAGENQSSFQLLTSQINRTATIDATRDWQASMSLQTSRQTFGDHDSGFNTSAIGSASYFEHQLFDIQNLGFRSDLLINGSGFSTAAREDQRLSERIDSQWINQLEYRIGKISMRLQGRIFRNNGELGNAIFFNILRRFD